MKPVSLSSEWAGALGMWWEYLWTSYPWIAFIPIILLTLLILAAKAMLESLDAVLSSEEHMTPVEPEKSIDYQNRDSLPPFQLLHNKNQ